MGVFFGIFFVIFAIINLCFIIPSLIYAYQNSTCVLTMVDGFSFNLKTWLQVDAYIRVGIVSLLLVVAIVSCISFKAGAGLSVCAICIMLLYNLFALAWIIVGSVLFWGKLKPLEVCSGGVNNYMYALLIISYVGICCNCFVNLSKGKNQSSF